MIDIEDGLNGLEPECEMCGDSGLFAGGQGRVYPCPCKDDAQIQDISMRNYDNIGQHIDKLQDNFMKSMMVPAELLRGNTR